MLLILVEFVQSLQFYRLSQVFQNITFVFPATYPQYFLEYIHHLISVKTLVYSQLKHLFTHKMPFCPPYFFYTELSIFLLT